MPTRLKSKRGTTAFLTPTERSRIKGWFMLTVGAGAAMWSTVRSAATRSGFITGSIIEATVFAVPGPYQPPDGRVGVQPTIRVTVGPGF